MEAEGLKRTASRVIWSVAAVFAIYAVHWALAQISAVALGNGGGDTFECLGRQTAYTCETAWGRWSPLLYLPELVLLVGGLVALALRSFRAWLWALGLAAAAVVSFVFVVSGTHANAINQMPWMWPSWA